MFENFDDILNIDDVAKALKIGTSQAYKLVRSGKIQAFKEGRAWKIAKQSLIQYIQNSTIF
jgi:excisionase family DNA binding protein